MPSAVISQLTWHIIGIMPGIIPIGIMPGIIPVDIPGIIPIGIPGIIPGAIAIGIIIGIIPVITGASPSDRARGAPHSRQGLDGYSCGPIYADAVADSSVRRRRLHFPPMRWMNCRQMRHPAVMATVSPN
jgi:hypothetical protein